MKTFAFLISFLAATLAATAQMFIPNQFFESWSDQLPLGWETNSCPPCMGPINQYIVVQDADSYSGAYAANLVANGTGTAAFATTRFAIAQHPVALNAFVKVLFPPCVNDNAWMEHDTVFIDVEILYNGAVVDAGHWMDASVTDTFDYVQVTIPVSQNSTQFDSCRITIRGGKVLGGCGFVAAPTEFKVDALAFTGAGGCYDPSIIPPVPCPCAPIVFPVCGCDGNTYDNSCVASCVFGISESSEEYCEHAFPAPPCNPSVLGTVVNGVEPGCKLVDIGTDLLLPCNAPAGFINLPAGSLVLISWSPEKCASFCMQGTSATIDCYVVLETVDTICMGDSVAIGHAPIPNELYTWVPDTGLSCSTCSNPMASPAVTSLYELQTSSTFCVGCPPVVTYYYVVVQDCDGCIDSSLMCPNCPCPLIWDPVCGCDGITYDNSCFAINSGVTSWTAGECGISCATFNVGAGGSPPSSFVAFNGSAHAIILSGGTGPFSYQWQSGSTNDSIFYLGDGTYCVTVTDALGCVDSACVSIYGDSLCLDPELFCPLCCDFVPVQPVCGCDGNTYNNGCEATYIGMVTAYTPGACQTGIRDGQNEMHIRVFPVPADERIFVSLFNLPHEMLVVQISDVVGAMIGTYETTASGSLLQFDVSGLAKGVYQLTVRSRNGHPVSSRFVKE